MAQRIVRAKNKIKGARIPYRVPSDIELPDRLRPVLAVVYLVFNEGYLASEGDALVRTELCEEAIRLARLLVQLMPDEAEAHGLLALLLLTESRRPARADAEGRLVRLGDQDRGRWDRTLIAEGQAIVRACLRRNLPGPYQIQAAIAAVHSDAPRSTDTDWGQIVVLYDQLVAVSPSPVVALNRAIAVAERDGPSPALALLDRLAADLDGYHLFHAARADLLHRLGRDGDAAAAYDEALARTTNGAERDLLQRQLVALRPPE
jgi:RNA polymerase sigma-70 factor (ECF subfamily)